VRAGRGLWSTPGLSATFGILLVVLVWQAAVIVLDLPNYVLPSPWEIVTEANWPEVMRSTGITSVAVLLSFVAGNLAGFLLAVLAAASVVASGIAQPISVTLRSVPVIAIAPLLTLYLGRGIVVTFVVGSLVVFFPTLVNMLLGLRSTEREVLELMRILDCSPLQAFWTFRLPASMPYLVAALRIAAPAAVLGVMVAEWVVGGDGLGQLILRSSMSIEYPTMWAAVIASACLAGLMFVLVTVLERVLIPWQARR